ncbi:baculoviral IAP repeat-containing protein 6-like isoform X2 [Anneissia japonica]|uniref:baculoviral IAP repeat-containing protein 6-like isoform X2 n=1 Tax=Anneissia japonica TaxID=1529436 RepID=UPI0014257268|nr:baculoviral IAP repeat-containing protein 6-like isoform X2 [Anneissia japonica]
MAAMDWLILEDGSLSIGEKTRGISYHPKLNTLLVVTEDSSLQVLDVNTGVILQKSTLCADPGSSVECKYLNEVEQVLFKSDTVIGLRKDISGVLLLDSALQAPVSKTDDFVVVELTHSEAIQLLACLKKVALPSQEYLEEVRDGLQMGIMGCKGAADHSNHKVAKWATVKMNLPHVAIRSVCSSLVSAPQNTNKPGLSIASAILDRLDSLYSANQPEFTPVGSTRTVDRSLMYTEAARRNTFSAWPHMDYKWALPDAMAQAGFYHGPTTPGDDRALCFTCSVCLVCWEPTDEPWSEHERHSPNCPHVRGEHTQNVPLAATLAAGPAQAHGSKSNHICCLSSITSKRYIATATENGSISLWDVSRQLAVCSQFTVKLASEERKAKLRKTSKTAVKEAWAEEGTSAKQKVPEDLEEPNQKDNIEKDEGYGTISDLPGSSWTSTQDSTYDICENVHVTALHVIDGESLLKGGNIAAVNGEKRAESAQGCQENKNFCYIFVGIRASLPEKSDGLISDAISMFGLKEKRSHKSILAIYSTSQRKIEETKSPKESKTKSKPALSETGKSGGVSTLSELLMPQVMSLDEQELNYVEIPLSLPPVDTLDPVDDPTSQDSAMKEGFQNITKFIMSIRLPSHIDNENLYVSSVFSSIDHNSIVVIMSPVDCLPVVKKNDNSSKCNVRVEIDKDVSKSNGLSKNHSDKDHSLGFDDADFNGEDVCDKPSVSNEFGVAINEDAAYGGEDEVDFGKPMGEKNTKPYGGYILVYTICSDEHGRIEKLRLQKSFIIEDPTRSVSDIILLPLESSDTNGDKNEDVTDAANLRDSSVSTKSNGTELSYGLDEVDGGITQNLGQFAALTKEGGVIFMDIATCSTLAYIPPSITDVGGKDGHEKQVDKFAALTYCSGMERISVCTESGELRFLQLLQRSATNQSAKDDIECDAGFSVTTPADQDEVFIQSAECLVNQPITADSLKQLTELTKFETLIPRFSATVPPCWTEIQQEQQQRRHPQHLHQKHHGDATQHTRTWKLAATGANEHLFELVLPKPSIIGHIDVKLNFQHFCDRVPGIQITLLKQTSQHGIGKDPTPVDTLIDFSMDMLFSDGKDSSKDPSNATSSLNMLLGDVEKDSERLKSVFLENHKNDIICGPLSLDSAIDVPGCSGLVTLTSHELLKSKYRSFLLHICNSEPLKTESSRSTRMNRKDPPFILTMFQNPPPVTPSEQISAFAFTKDLDRIQGCDWIQEISVTIRKTKRPPCVYNDRVQRLAMLESSSFHRKIVNILIGSKSSIVCGSKEFTRSLALDILCWVAGVQVSEPNRTSSSIVDAVQREMRDIVRVCFLESGRSIAHRCSQLFMLCIGCTKNQGKEAMAAFHDTMLQGLLKWVPSILNTTSAGSLHWFFLLLNLVKSGDLESTSETCASFLNAVAKQLQEKMLPQHALLRAKYGLHGTPLDPVMYDGPAIFLPAKTSVTSSASTIQQPMNTFAPPLPATSTNFQQSLGSDGKTLGENGKGNGNGNGELVPAPGGVMMKGILEVEPLHFVCCATSDGTQVKKTGVEGVPVATLHAGGMNVNESSAGGPAAAAALSALSNAMTSAEQQLQVLQHRTQMLVKLQQRKQKLAQKLQYASSLGHPNAESLYTNQPKTNSSSHSWAQLSLEPTPGPSWYLSPGKSFAQAITHGPAGKNGNNSGGTTKSPPNGGQSTKSASTVCVQSLIQPPQPHLLVIDRMHSGARRYVTLDFGRPILLTDVFIPSCTELASLSIDLWSQGEEIDGQRLVVSMDISKRDLTMNDLLPPPLCRYVKITVIGRYGRNTVRTKIPIGCFYGHSFVFPWEQEHHVSGMQLSASSSLDETVSVEQYAQSVTMLQEDIHCRYRLACDRLEHLLDEAHRAFQSPSQATRKEDKNGMSTKMRKAYMECIQLQNQLNLVQRVIHRLKQVNQEDDFKLEILDKESSVRAASADQLRVVAEYLVGCLISITSINSSPATLTRIMGMDSCKALFKNLIMCGTPRLQTCTGALLLRVCRSQVWWGEFLATSLEELFNSEQTEVFPQERVFVLLALMGHRSIMSGNMGVLENFLSLLAKLLSPLQNTQAYYRSCTGNLDLPLIGWVLLFLSRTLEQAAPPVIETQTEEDENGNDVGATKEDKKSKHKAGSRWDFINSDLTTTEVPKAQRGSVNQAQRQRLAKQMKMHEEQIKQLETKHKAIQTMLVEEGKDKDPLVLQKVFKEYKQHKSKHSKDLLRIRRLAYQELHQKKDSKGDDETTEQPTEFVHAQIRLPREQCIPVVQGLTQLLLAMDFTCHVDLFLVACKVLARICNSTRPAITLAEVMTQQQLQQLLMLCVGSKFNCGSSSWGGPWASHAIICLLQDVLEGELMHPVIESTSQGAYGEERLEVDSDLTSDAAPEIEVAGATGGADENGTSGNLFDVIGDAASHFPTLSSTPEESLLVHSTQQPSFISDPLDIGYPLPDEAEDYCFGSTKYYSLWEDGYSMKSPKLSGKYLPSKVIATSSSGRILYQSMNGNGNGKGPGSGALQNVSLAMDARLELGLQMQAEWFLKISSLTDVSAVSQAQTNCMPSQPGQCSVDLSDSLDSSSIESPLPTISSTQMLTVCFNQLFGDLQSQRINMEALLQLWLTLNINAATALELKQESKKFNASLVPTITLSQESMSHILACLARQPNTPLQTWCLTFQSLCCLANSRSQDTEEVVEAVWMANAMVEDPNLLCTLVQFFSGNITQLGENTIQGQAGPSVVQAVKDFLVRLEMRVTTSPEPHTNTFKTLLLDLLQILVVEPRGAFQVGTGPLDAQIFLLECILEQQFHSVDVSKTVNLIDAIILLVHNHLSAAQQVTSHCASTSTLSARACFTGLFASMLRAVESKSTEGGVGRDDLMCYLLRLVNSLVGVPIGTVEVPLSDSNIPDNHKSNTPESENSNLEPMTDSSKINAAQQQQDQPQGASGTSFFCISDEEKQRTGEGSELPLNTSAISDEEKSSASTSSSVPATTECTKYIADIILSQSRTVTLLLSALSHCNSNTMAMIIGSSGFSQITTESLSAGESVSVGDNIFQVLCTLNTKATVVDLILKNILSYISAGAERGRLPATAAPLSEPLLWFILRALSTDKALEAFHNMGGIQLICRNLVCSNQTVIDTTPSAISSIMQRLGVTSKTNGGAVSTSTSIPKSRAFSTETETIDGLYNFAPHGTISSTSPTAQPAEVLIQPQAPHRRARSPAWSYHFYPDESWCDLTITLPGAVLIKEIHIQPHLASLATCPSAVAIELSRDGYTSVPISSPISTGGVTYIKLQLQKPEITRSVCLKLHRPRDSSTIGLSQIMLLGLSAFSNMSSVQNPFLPTEDAASKSSIGWLRLLHHCLTQSSSLESMMSSAASTSTPHLLTTCMALLLSRHSLVHASNIEVVLLRIGLHSTELGLSLFDILLRNLYLSDDDGQTPLLLGRGHGGSSDSTVEIIYQLGMTQDQGTKERVQALLEWLGDTARVALHKHSTYQRAPHTLSPLEVGLLVPSPAHIHCVATIIWSSFELPVHYDLQSLLTQELFSSIYEWSMVLPSSSTLKKAADFVLCAMCYVQPSFFTSMMEWMGVVHDTSLDMVSHLTDDSKGAEKGEVAGSHDQQLPTHQPITIEDLGLVILNEDHLTTLAIACRSESASQQLITSGFLAILTQALVEFCEHEFFRSQSESLQSTSLHSLKSPRGNRQKHRTDSVSSDYVTLTADLVAPVLNFFGEVSHEPAMKEWLGGAEGNVFWKALLNLLCNNSANECQAQTVSSSRKKSTVLTSQQRSSIENAAISFFSKTIACHSENQRKLAEVICDVICYKNGPSGSSLITGFTRRLILQLMLEDEKILLHLKSACHLYKPRTAAPTGLQHPRFGTGHKFRTIEVELIDSISKILSQVSDTPSLTAKFLEKEIEKQKPLTDKLSLPSLLEDITKSKLKKVAGKADSGSKVTTKTPGTDSKSETNGKDSSSAYIRPPTRRGRLGLSRESMSIPTLSLHHSMFPNQALPHKLTLGQLMVLLKQRGLNSAASHLHFTMKLTAKSISALQGSSSKMGSIDDSLSDKSQESDVIPEAILLDTPAIPSFLHVFASMGGLALIAEHLPMLYSETPHPEVATTSSVIEKNADDNIKGEWLPADIGGMESGIEENWFQYMEEANQGGSSSYNAIPLSSATAHLGHNTAIPAHSLAAFGLFLRLPGYAEVLLKEHKKAQFLLRLILGVTDDGEGGHILSSPQASCLPTLPFSILITLLHGSPLTTDDGVLLRRMTLDIGALHLVLACMSVLSHYGPRVTVPATSSEASGNVNGVGNVASSENEKSQNYWAKGTGFGTGSTTSGWDVEQALNKQKVEEEHVTCLLQVLSAFINPSGQAESKEDASEGMTEDQLVAVFPPVFVKLLSHSCLFPAISSYLRNDSVLDMARHIPLYCAVLELLRALASCPNMVELLLPLPDHDDEKPTTTTCITSLLESLKACVDTYTSKLQLNKDSKTPRKNIKDLASSVNDDPETEGLTLLVPDIQNTVEIVRKATKKYKVSDNVDSAGAMVSMPLSIASSPEERYCAVMKTLQFDTYRMVSEDENGKTKFNIPHHYSSSINLSGNVKNPKRARRLAQEAVTISTSLPLSASSSVFVRCDEERLDLMKVLITAPCDTPYANGCFEFDVYFPSDYPTSPMQINLETTGQHSIRFNPNLYNDGKVCLSILNTWHGRPEEKWNPNTSSFLQVLVSIQSLILVSEPYFNEPGYERSRGTPAGTQSSHDYDANIMQATVRWAMLEMVRNPPLVFKNVIQNHFYLKKAEIMAQCEEWVSLLTRYCSNKRVGKTMAHHLTTLKRHTAQLREELKKLKPPKNLLESDKGEKPEPLPTPVSTQESTSHLSKEKTDEQAQETVTKDLKAEKETIEQEAPNPYLQAAYKSISKVENSFPSSMIDDDFLSIEEPPFGFDEVDF